MPQWQHARPCNRTPCDSRNSSIRRWRVVQEQFGNIILGLGLNDMIDLGVLAPDHGHPKLEDTPDDQRASSRHQSLVGGGGSTGLGPGAQAMEARSYRAQKRCWFHADGRTA